MGATGFAYDLARQFGLKVVEPRPALVPLTLGGEDVLFRELSGVATPVEAHAGKAAFREAALFTHRGLSGPASLQEIGRASCRERVCQYGSITVVAVALKQKIHQNDHHNRQKETQSTHSRDATSMRVI